MMQQNGTHTRYKQAPNTSQTRTRCQDNHAQTSKKITIIIVIIGALIHIHLLTGKELIYSSSSTHPSGSQRQIFSIITGLIELELMTMVQRGSRLHTQIVEQANTWTQGMLSSSLPEDGSPIPGKEFIRTLTVWIDTTPIAGG